MGGATALTLYNMDAPPPPPPRRVWGPSPAGLRPPGLGGCGAHTAGAVLAPDVPSYCSNLRQTFETGDSDRKAAQKPAVPRGGPPPPPAQRSAAGAPYL